MAASKCRGLAESTRERMMAVKTYSIERLPDIPKGDVYLLPVSQYPLPQSEVGHMSMFIDSLVEKFQSTHGRLSLEVIIRQSRLYTGLVDTFVDNARQWMPEQGLAVIPHKPPPHIPGRDEVAAINPIVMSQRGIEGVIDLPEFVFRITDEAGREQCSKILAGHGALNIILTRLASNELKQAWKELFGKRVTDRAFRSMRSFIPIFGAQSFRGATEHDLSSWFESFELYIGESKEDRGIVIASGRNIEGLVEEVRKELPEPFIEPEAEILRW
jgi:hypothetical protein